MVSCQGDVIACVMQHQWLTTPLHMLGLQMCGAIAAAMLEAAVLQHIMWWG